MESFRQDVRLGIRLLLKQRAFSLLAITTLGLGIGASVALFSVLDAAFIRPLPYPNPEQLVEIGVEQARQNGETYQVGPSAADVEDWKRHGALFTHVATSRNAFTQPLILDGDEPQRLLAERVTRDYFPMYGAAPFVGRDFTADEYARGAADVVIIGYKFWQTRFGGNREIVGSTIRLNGAAATIVGVMPEWFYAKTKVWQPFDSADYFHKQRGSGAGTEGRLRAGISMGDAEAALTAVLDRATAERGGPKGRVKLTSMYEAATASNRKTARVIAYAVGVVLLLACVNVAGLLLAKGAVRGPEMAVRSSLGAGRGRLVRQLLTESLILATCGAGLGLLLAWWWLDVLVANTPMYLPSNAPVAINMKALAFAAASALAATVLIGLLPALRVSGISMSATLARAGRAHGTALSRRGGQALIGVEVALAVVLMAGAGLMIRSFTRVLAVDLGFDPSAAIALDVSPVTPTAEAHAQYYPALVRDLSMHPATEAVGAVDNAPLIGGGTYTFVAANGKTHPVTIRRYVGAYFEAVGFQLKDGRFPSASRTAGLPPAVISEAAARKIFGDSPPLGNTLEAWKTQHEIVAVMRDVRYRGPLSTRPLDPEVFVPATTLASTTHAPRPLIVIVRQREGATFPPNFFREAVQGTGQRAVLQEITPGSAWLDDVVVTPRRRTVLLGLLGALGLVLALVGIFGVTAYAVSRRTREIGVRMAFGATHRSVVGIMVRDSSWAVLTGLIAGLLASWWVTKAISTFLFQTEPRDLITFATVAALLAVAAVVAAWIPARRAARIDPIVALRAD